MLLTKKRSSEVQVPYISRDLRKAIMKRSQLKNKYYKINTPENLNSYKKQKIFCDKLYKKESNQYFNNLDVSNITEIRYFRKPESLYCQTKELTYLKSEL